MEFIDYLRIEVLFVVKKKERNRRLDADFNCLWNDKNSMMDLLPYLCLTIVHIILPDFVLEAI